MIIIGCAPELDVMFRPDAAVDFLPSTKFCDEYQDKRALMLERCDGQAVTFEQRVVWRGFCCEATDKCRDMIPLEQLLRCRELLYGCPRDSMIDEACF